MLIFLRFLLAGWFWNGGGDLSYFVWHRGVAHGEDFRANLHNGTIVARGGWVLSSGVVGLVAGQMDLNI